MAIITPASCYHSCHCPAPSRGQRPVDWEDNPSTEPIIFMLVAWLQDQGDKKEDTGEEERDITVMEVVDVGKRAAAACECESLSWR